jgi:long-subunit acyl-CoA synthetase (AMP-forming)
MEIRDLVTMASVSYGRTVGEVMVRGSTVMSGYYKDAAAMAGAMHRVVTFEGTCRAAPRRVHLVQGPVQ